jgi:hypothetical protein
MTYPSSWLRKLDEPWSWARQPNNAIAAIIGKATFDAATIPRLGPPNHVDIGLALLRELEAKGMGVVKMTGV